MRPTLFGGPLLVLLWQTAPVSVQQDPGGKLEISLGYGGGQYEVRHYSCAGNYLGADPHPFDAVTAHADLWPNRRFHLSGFACTYSDAGQVSTMYGLAAAAEFGHVGLGLGRSFGYVGDAMPSYYLRLGNIDKGHFRADVAYPNAAFPVTGAFRFGVGFNKGVRRGTSGFVGLSGPNIDAGGTVGAGPFLEITFPTYEGLGISLNGAFRPSRKYNGWSLGIAGHYVLPIRQLVPVPK